MDKILESETPNYQGEDEPNITSVRVHHPESGETSEFF